MNGGSRLVRDGFSEARRQVCFRLRTTTVPESDLLCCLEELSRRSGAPRSCCSANFVILARQRRTIRPRFRIRSYSRRGRGRLAAGSFVYSAVVPSTRAEGDALQVPDRILNGEPAADDLQAASEPKAHRK